MAPKKYKYGKSLISTNLKYEFNTNSSRSKKKYSQLDVELKIYQGRRIVDKHYTSYYNLTIDQLIDQVFQIQIEHNSKLEKGKYYYAVFKIYENKHIRRPIYIKTNEYIDTTRRKYMLQERINFYF